MKPVLFEYGTHPGATRSDGQRLLGFHCPACKYEHAYQVPRWTWNGSMTKPTFTPSLLLYDQKGSGPRTTICHLFITDGVISYCGDCPHELAGKSVPMIPYDDEGNAAP